MSMTWKTKTVTKKNMAIAAVPVTAPFTADALATVYSGWRMDPQIAGVLLLPKLPLLVLLEGDGRRHFGAGVESD